MEYFFTPTAYHHYSNASGAYHYPPATASPARPHPSPSKPYSYADITRMVRQSLNNKDGDRDKTD